MECSSARICRKSAKLLPHLALSSLLLVFGISVGGCGASIKTAAGAAAEGATPAVASSTLALLEDQKTRERVANVLATPEVQRAIAAAARGVVHGASEEAGANLPSLLEQVTQTVVKTVRANADGIGDSIDIVTRKAVSAAIDEALSAGHQAQLQRLLSGMTEAMMKTTAAQLTGTLAPAMRKALTDEIGPALGEVVQKDVAPALAGLLASPEVKTALAATTREIARQAVLGSNEGLAELAEKRKHDTAGSPLGIVGTFFSERTWLLAALVTAGVLALPIFWLVRERRLAKRYREDAERRSHRAAAILSAMQAIKGSNEDSREVLSLLKEELFDGNEDLGHAHANSRARAHPHH